MTPGPAPRHTTVIIDDQPDVRMLLRLSLERFGPFSVVAEAADGKAGLEAVLRTRPDVVLLDLAMPVMDGLEALPHIRRAVPTATVAILSGFEASAMTDVTRAAGADAYLQKGLPPQQIAAQLATLAARRAHQDSPGGDR